MIIFYIEDLARLHVILKTHLDLRKENLIPYKYFFNYLRHICDKPLFDIEISFSHWKLSNRIGVETPAVASEYGENIFIFLLFYIDYH